MRPKQSQGKKRLCSTRISSDSGSQSDEPEAKCSAPEDESIGSPKRVSHRLISKRNRPDFKLPTRDSIWKGIPSMKSPEKLNQITPRKSISNFIKVCNSYNFDDYDDDSTDEDDVSDSSSSSSSEDQAPKQVKNSHKRFRIASSSSEEGDKASDTEAKCYQPDTQAVSDEISKKDIGDQGQNNPSSTAGETIVERSSSATDLKVPETIDNTVLHSHTSSSHDSNDSDETFTPSKRLNHRAILDSDDDNESDNNISTNEKAEQNDLRLQRSNNLKQKQKSLFSDFKDVIAKTKSRLGNS
ncbi:hypothetical protein EGW08_015856 [Elysia chlorotica]|uniref:Uncharacterized protein n=1 Tax=Elysia chlorotica TaxID=188477 RepID=A0A3S1AZT2_ELYCH|nr:hypothetical protein EGW08_015856 [Elysia chlorotica]